MKTKMPAWQKLLYCLWAVCLLVSGAGPAAASGPPRAAEWTLTGQVVTTEGDPLPGVSVQVRGTDTGTSTGQEGRYRLSVPERAGTLVFSYLGFITREIPFSGPGEINVTLQEDIASLEEIVVTGYAAQRRKDLTGAVSVVEVEDMNRQPTGQVTSQLQGQASGVTVLGSGQPGEQPNVTIRGANTFEDNNPLYVVDGVPTREIGDLNPGDVESVQVLKDAGAASIYGARASNGVIIITTRKGSGKVSVQYDAWYGVQVPRGGNAWNTLTPMEMAELKFMAMRNSGRTDIDDPYYGSGPEPVLPDYLVPVGAAEGDPEVDPSLYNVDPDYTDPDVLGSFYRIVRANKEGTDWYNEIFDTAPTTSHNLRVSGSSEGGSYLFSASYFNQQGTLSYTGLERVTVRSNTSFRIGENVRIGENIAFSLTNNPVVDINAEGSPIGMAMRSQPIIPVYDIMGNYAGSYGHEIGPARNPVAILERTRNDRNTATRLFGNVFAEADILEHFVLRTSFGGSLDYTYEHSFTYPEYENAENQARNFYSESAGRDYNWTWTNTLSYQRVIGEAHDLTVLAGIEAYDSYARSVGGTTQDYFSFDPDYITLPTGGGNQTNTSSKSSESLHSLIGRLDYSFRDRYLLGATIRRDGSSKFLGNRYGWFPAVSAAWRISEEDFLSGIAWLTDLKVRGGWGIMGNQLNVDPMNAFSTYASDRLRSYYDIEGTNNSIVEGFFLNRFGNPEARWEKNVQANAGIDATILDGRLELSADYYRKDVRDLLYNPQLLGTAGLATAPYINVASMKNSGLDLTVSGRTGIGRDLQLRSTLTFTTYHNEIVKVADNSTYFEVSGRRFSNGIVRNQVGRPLGEFFGYRVEGFWDEQAEIDAADEQAREVTGNPNAVYQTDVSVGRFRYADVNGDGLITPDDRTGIGDPNPDFTYGLNIGLDFRNFDLSVFFYGSQGNDLWNNLRWWRDFFPAFQGAKSKTALYDSWTPERRDATAPIQELSASFSTNNVPNSYFVEDGSYLRLKNMQVGYSFSPALAGKLGLERLRVYLQGANLFTVTGYSGVDPEITGSSVAFGIDEGTYPSQRQYMLGIDARF